MVAGSIPDDRCGYTYDVHTFADVGGCSCWRPTWRDDEHCIWHATDAEKTYDELETHAPDGPERLDGAFVHAVDLDGVDWFEGCSLVGAEFSAVDLRDASLVGTDLREASLEEVDARGSDFTDSNLEDTSILACDLRFAILRRTRFDQTVLSNARINRGTEFGESIVYENELEASSDEEGYIEFAQAAIWSYREIQNLYEANALPYEARHYYLKEKDVRRKLAWRAGEYLRAVKAEGARWITGYGMSPWRVLATAAVVIVVSALLYPTTGGLEETFVPGGLNEQGTATGNQTTITWTIEDPETTPQYYLVLVFFRSLYFSVVTFATLGYGDISPVGDFARAVAGIEALLGQLLVALLVFVLSRRIS